MIKQFLVKFLLRNLSFGSDPRKIENEVVKDWLARQAKDQGFMEYLRQREIGLRQQASQKVLDEDERQLIAGQILELHNLQHNVKRIKDQED